MSDVSFFRRVAPVLAASKQAAIAAVGHISQKFIFAQCTCASYSLVNYALKKFGDGQMWAIVLAGVRGRAI